MSDKPTSLIEAIIVIVLGFIATYLTDYIKR